MSSRQRTTAEVADAELIVLKMLLDSGPGTVRELLERLHAIGQDWAYTTVQTLLSRLQEKGYVRANRRDLAHVFAAKVTRDQFAGQRTDEVTDTILDGAIAPLVLRLVQKGKFSTTEIEHFKSLLADAERRAAEATEKTPCVRVVAAFVEQAAGTRTMRIIGWAQPAAFPRRGSAPPWGNAVKLHDAPWGPNAARV